MLSGGEITFLNSMRSTEDGQLCHQFYSIDNNTKFRSYNSQAVNMLFRENVILENIEADDLLSGELIYKILEPINRLFRLFGMWYTSAKQG